MSATLALAATQTDDPVTRSARCLGADDLEGALVALQQAGGGDAGTPRFNFMMCLVAWRMAEIARAITLALDCHQREPMNGTIAEVLGSLFAQVGNLEDSLYFGKLAIALGAAPGFAELLPANFPSFDQAFLAIEERPLLVRGRFLLASGNWRDGLDLVQQHVTLTPADDEARIVLGEAMLRANQAGGAAQALESRAGAAGAPPALIGLCARALAMSGEPARARQMHAQACAAAPDDAAIAAARIADAFWDEPGPAVVGDPIAAWTRRFLPAPKPSAWSRPQGKLVIGYLVAGMADPRDAATVAAVAAAHDRNRATVVAFGHGAQSWEQNAALSGAFDRWRDIAGIDPATLSRILRGEGLHAIVDCAGFAAPAQINALGRVNSAVRIAWLGIPSGIDAPIFDAVLGTGAGALPCWGARYPFAHDRMRRLTRISATALRFGADVGMAQLDAQTVALWSAVLRARPGAVLLLRANDMRPGPNIDRLVDRFGRELAARVDVVQAGPTEEFYQRVDVALAPLRGSSPRMAAEALTCGVPVVAMDLPVTRCPYGAFLRDCRLVAAVASDERRYLSIALELAGSPEARQRAIAPLADLPGDRQGEARQVAAIIESRVAAALAAALP